MTCLTIRPSANPSSAAAFSLPRSGKARLLTATTLVLLASLSAHYPPRASAGIGGTSARSQNFIATAPTQQFAQQICIAAEQYRRDLALQWLGRELPPWQDPCPIRVTVGERLGAGGATSFTFINGQPRQWNMEIQGSRARVLDSVLPHEITHTIMATHFGRPLPRWADEGAATSVEHTSERTKQDKLLIEFLTTNRGIAFNRMFAMKEYPRDILPLYSQGYSLARYLIARGGKRRFVQYVGDGMEWNNWTAATQQHYGMENLSELQLTWLDWVRNGSPALPEIQDDSALALTTPGTAHPGGPARETASALVPLPAPTTPPATTGPTVVASPSDGWYSRRLDEALRAQGDPAIITSTRQQVGRPGTQRY